MKGTVVQFLGALMLAVVGAGLSAAGRLEERVAEMERRLATLQYSAPAEEYDRIERTVSYLTRLPWIASRLTRVRESRATSEYWLRDYDPLAASRDTSRHTALRLVAANAAYRTAKLDNANRQALLRRLDGVIKGYAEVLKDRPTCRDAAYNYEFVARVRAAVEARGNQRTASARPPAAPSADAPSGRTLHGERGALPQNADMSQFKMVMPKTGEERNTNPEAGKGNAKVRKG